MKTAQNVPRVGLAKATGAHLTAANELVPPAEMELWRDRTWRYTPAIESDIRATFKRHGWAPNLTRKP